MLNSTVGMGGIGSQYGAGKWGRFLRAPDIYFRLMRVHRNSFVRLGEIAEIRRGITSGADAFFMPRDVTLEVLEQLSKGLTWNEIPLMTPCKRSEVESGQVKIVRAGDSTIHPIEAQYVRSEVHSLMDVKRPVIRARDLDRVVLWVNQPLDKLGNTYAGKYIRWGARQTFASKKSKAVPVPQRSTCAGRPVWYDLTNDKVGVAFWPKAQKYRHIIPANPEELVCNCNLYTLVPKLKGYERTALSAILNSTLVGLFKCFYGRYAGAEGTLKTEVVDTVLLEIPDPRGITSQLSNALSQALQKMTSREVTHLVEDALLECHSEGLMREILRTPPKLPRELLQPDRRELDLCVLELIGVKDEQEREQLLDELYLETANYYRYQRTQDIQATEDRSANVVRRFGAQELAEGIWHTLSDDEKVPPIKRWIKETFKQRESVNIPEGKPQYLGSTDMFNPTAVIFKDGKGIHQVNYRNPEQAELVSELARHDIRGDLEISLSSNDSRMCLDQLHARLKRAEKRFSELAASRTGTQLLQEKTTGLLLQWLIHGKD